MVLQVPVLTNKPGFEEITRLRQPGDKVRQAMRLRRHYQEGLRTSESREGRKKKAIPALQ